MFQVGFNGRFSAFQAVSRLYRMFQRDFRCVSGVFMEFQEVVSGEL